MESAIEGIYNYARAQAPSNALRGLSDLSEALSWLEGSTQLAGKANGLNTLLVNRLDFVSSDTMPGEVFERAKAKETKLNESKTVPEFKGTGPIPSTVENSQRPSEKGTILYKMFDRLNTRLYGLIGTSEGKSVHALTGLTAYSGNEEGMGDIVKAPEKINSSKGAYAAEPLLSTLQAGLKNKAGNESDIHRAPDTIRHLRIPSIEAISFVSPLPGITTQWQKEPPDANLNWKSKEDALTDTILKYSISATDRREEGLITAPGKTLQIPNISEVLVSNVPTTLPDPQPFTPRLLPMGFGALPTGSKERTGAIDEFFNKNLVNATMYEYLYNTRTYDEQDIASNMKLPGLHDSSNVSENENKAAAMPFKLNRKHRREESKSVKPVIININRPLIEHFSIHSSTASEGLTRFKQRVEEVLLEILDSANVIN